MHEFHEYTSTEEDMTIDESLLEVRAYGGEGYMPLIDYGEWRVAILRYADELLPQNIDNMQRHDETDEVFVLLAGRCMLFIGEGQEDVSAIHAQDMQPLKLYNVKVGCWHTHTLSEDATVLVVENRDTTLQNSPRIPLNPSERTRLIDLTRARWGV
jgi:mannose-6-phosphate isomerase-like protein (cupin superfamily)